MLQKLLWWAFTLRVALCDCHNERKNEGFSRGKNLYKMTKTGTLPAAVNETSGLALGSKTGNLWTLNDSGNPSELYEVDAVGNIMTQLKLPKLRNMDWEDLAQDNKGNLFIADVGNNSNQRKDLTIYKINPKTPDNFETIRLSYADQTDFPPLPEQRNFDCEATVWYKNKLYLFSKNRSKTNRFVKLYSIPDSEGTYVAASSDSVYSKAMVTAADISPDGKTLALLTYGKVLLFDVEEDLNFNKPRQCIKTGKGQTEAIVFVNNTDFVITNERKAEMWSIKRK
jgi:SdiA-regulated